MTNRLNPTIKTIAFYISAIFTFMFGDKGNQLLQILVIFVILDYISGVMKSAYEGKLDSEIGWKGILTKLGFFIAISFAYWLDVFINSMGAVMIEGFFKKSVCFLLIANEGVSISENLLAINVPLKWLQKILKRMLKNGRGKVDD